MAGNLIQSDQIRDPTNAVGDVIKLVDVGGGTPGLPAVDGSQLTNVTAAPKPQLFFTVGQDLGALDLPAFNLASDVMSVAGNVDSIRARRATPGSSGTTTIQLELNGSPVSGATVSWTTSDGAFAEKTASFGPQAVVAGDRLSIRVTATEVGGEDVIGVVY